MKLVLWVLIAFVVLGISTHGQNDGRGRVVYEPARFYNGEEFHEMNESDRTIYLSGLLDGFYGSTMLGAPDKTVNSLVACLKIMDNKQLTAIASKYVNDNPDRWHYPMSVLVYNGLSSGACKGSM